MRRLLPFVAVFLLAGSQWGCGGSSSTTTRTVTLTWAQNHEAEVNKAGGGYTVEISGQAPIDVPWTSALSIPPSTTVPLPSGTYTVMVKAYSNLNRDGSRTRTSSAASSSIPVTVP
jgi:hypothetical protein